jgi:hypothetical protein
VVGPNSPAATAGLKTGDVITKIGDTTVQNDADLVRAIRNQSPGDNVTVTYTRDGTSAQSVTLGDRSTRLAAEPQPTGRLRASCADTTGAHVRLRVATESIVPVEPGTPAPNLAAMAQGVASRTDAVLRWRQQGRHMSLFVSLSTHPDVAPSTIGDVLLPAGATGSHRPFSSYQGTSATGRWPVRLKPPELLLWRGAVASMMDELLTNPRAGDPARASGPGDRSSRARSGSASRPMRRSSIPRCCRRADRRRRRPENEKVHGLPGAAATLTSCRPGSTPSAMPRRGLVREPSRSRGGAPAPEWLGLDPTKFPTTH